MKTLALVIPLALVAAACGPRQTPAERVQAQTDRVLQAIDANATQQAAIKAAVADFTMTALAARAVHKDMKGVVQSQLAAAQPDGAVLNAQAARAHGTLADTAHALVDTVAVVHQTLDAQQRARLIEEIKPGRWSRAGMNVAGRMGYGPPTDKADLNARMEKRLERGLERIDATDVQRAALLPIARGLLADAAPIFERRDALVTALTSAWGAASFDATALHAQIDAELKPVGALFNKAAVGLAQAHAVLTPQQRSEIAAGLGESDCDGDESAVTESNPRAKKAN